MTDGAGLGLIGTAHGPPAPSPDSGLLQEAPLHCGRNLTEGETGGEEEGEHGLLTAFSTFHFPEPWEVSWVIVVTERQCSPQAFVASSGAGSVHRSGTACGRLTP